jgi:hypothetical protein
MTSSTTSPYINALKTYGPTNRAYASLNSDGRKALRDDLTALWTRNNTARDGTTQVLAEYVEVIGTRHRLETAATEPKRESEAE